MTGRFGFTLALMSLAAWFLWDPDSLCAQSIEPASDETPSTADSSPGLTPVDLGPIPVFEPIPEVDRLPPVYDHPPAIVTYEPLHPCPDFRGCEWNANTVPNMMGDFLGVQTDLLTVQGDELLDALPSDVFDPATLGTGAESEFLLVSPAAGVLGRQKPAENNSPFPRNRASLNYSYVGNATLQDGGVGVHRFTPGIERTFVDDRFSWELRLPVGVTFDSDSVLTGGASRDALEFGNVHLGLKSLLYSRQNVAISAGLGATFPTADNLSFSNANGRELIRVENGAFHLLPYVAGVWSDGGWFWQSFLTLDYDLGKNSVLIDDGTGLMRAGDFRDSDFLYWDVGTGYWLIKDRDDGLITGFAPTLEVHYNTALNSTKGVQSTSGFQFGGNRSQIEMVNVLLGATIQLAGRNSLAIGYGRALRGGDDEQFDSELRVLFNWYFGGK